MVKRIVFSKNGVGIIGIYLQKNETGLLRHTIYKMIKWIKGLNEKAKAIQFLWENTGVCLFDHGISNGFLVRIPKTNKTKDKK